MTDLDGSGPLGFVSVGVEGSLPLTQVKEKVLPPNRVRVPGKRDVDGVRSLLYRLFVYGRKGRLISDLREVLCQTVPSVTGRDRGSGRPVGDGEGDDGPECPLTHVGRDVLT